MTEGLKNSSHSWARLSAFLSPSKCLQSDPQADIIHLTVIISRPQAANVRSRILTIAYKYVSSHFLSTLNDLALSVGKR
jgi:hypothetical protein